MNCISTNTPLLNVPPYAPKTSVSSHITYFDNSPHFKYLTVTANAAELHTRCIAYLYISAYIANRDLVGSPASYRTVITNISTAQSVSNFIYMQIFTNISNYGCFNVF